MVLERAIALAAKAIVRAEKISALADQRTRYSGQEAFAWGAPDEPIVIPEDAGPLDQLITKYASQHRLDPDLIRALIKVESNFNPGAVSVKGAQGLMQLMPETARRYGVRNILNSEDNLAGGVRYLSDLLQMFNGNVPLALSAYNAGENLIARIQRVPDIPETRNYVSRIGRMFDFRRSPFLPPQ
jgi:soluble lytic murein transglycosylase-like protein